ncbi:potassium channel family protein [Ilumatobacter sp.]|uniref:potassium channel family protein n=1 Tax=Ilumatobacter sp. TaxID=1967498 RepID=UPI003C611FA2
MAEKRFARHVMRGFGSQTDRPPDRVIEHRGEIVVIGLGRFGSSLSRTLVGMGHEVLGLDVDPARVQEHTGVLTHVAEVDTTSVRALTQLGVADATTVIVCIGNDVEASVLTTAALDDLGIPNVWAKAMTEAHGRILSRVGAHSVVFPENDMGKRVAHLVTGQMLEYVSLDDDFVLAEMNAPRLIVGIPLGDSNLRRDHRVTIVCHKPDGGKFTHTDRDTVLTTSDLIVVAGVRDDVEAFGEAAR